MPNTQASATGTLAPVPHTSSRGLWQRPLSRQAHSEQSWRHQQRHEDLGEERWSGMSLGGSSLSAQDLLMQERQQLQSEVASLQMYLREEHRNAAIGFSRNQSSFQASGPGIQGDWTAQQSEMHALSSKVAVLQSELSSAVKAAQAQRHEFAASYSTLAAQVKATASMNATVAQVSTQLSKVARHASHAERGCETLKPAVDKCLNNSFTCKQVPTYQLSSTRSRSSTHRLEEEIENRERQHEATVAELQKQIALLRSKEHHQTPDFFRGEHHIDLELSLLDLGRTTSKLNSYSRGRACGEEVAVESLEAVQARSEEGSTFWKSVLEDSTGTCEVPLPELPASQAGTARSQGNGKEVQQQPHARDTYHQSCETQLRTMQCEVQMLRNQLCQIQQRKGSSSSEVKSSSSCTGAT
eukprot:gnl/MRDRNA2_/MRDRNA2_197819_c0_seq1.p1 gnl/MRDRNA2_/MRDRNA2_197819_c0~~gnl/MRDRNA2_/MRDRNA2_197819_c0_seq1.p1  ORF type:complete len:465 (-),score=92.73 gnl/MRDRNA2_/MRDRNA2_197819_c0_seq1:98-1333(-)